MIAAASPIAWVPVAHAETSETGILGSDAFVAIASNGDIVVALVEDEATVKRLRRRRGRWVLQPENPSFTRRRGFPDKWFYDGETNRWVQPVPVSRARNGR
mgnify:CR=1 FL=1